MGRRKMNHERLEVKVPTLLFQQVQQRLTLRYNGKPQFGAMSRLVETLLKKWIEGEVAIDPLHPVSLSLDNLIEEIPHEVSPTSPEAT
jgi:hypothetical protein